MSYRAVEEKPGANHALWQSRLQQSAPEQTCPSHVGHREPDLCWRRRAALGGHGKRREASKAQRKPFHVGAGGFRADEFPSVGRSLETPSFIVLMWGSLGGGCCWGSRGVEEERE